MQFARLRNLIKRDVDSVGQQTVTMPEDLFRHLLNVALRSKGFFDEDFYLARYSDLRSAVDNGLLRNGAQHYYRAGYYEGRLPAKIAIDEKFYVNEQPDIIDGLRSGVVRDVQQHFEEQGFGEGRLPYPGFTLF